MKNLTRDELQAVALVGFPALTRVERLERWAACLSLDPDRQLLTLHETEYQRAEVRHGMRREGTPISVAFYDPLLRATGMRNDTYGEALRFFEIRDRDLHKVLCYCQYGDTVKAARAARAVERIAHQKPGWFARLREKFVAFRTTFGQSAPMAFRRLARAHSGTASAWRPL